MRTINNRAKNGFFSRQFLILLAGCLAVILPVIFFVIQIKTAASFRDVAADLNRGLDSLCENYLLSLDTEKEIISRNDRIYQSHTAAIAEALRRSGEEAFSESTLRSLCSTFEVGNLAIITPDGRELCSAYPHAMDFFPRPLQSA